ncbi:MAG: rhomboid family intramembrane serine protease [bacterium]
MFIPYSRDNPLKRFPIVCALLIAANFAVFLATFANRDALENVRIIYGLKPSSFHLYALFTHMFLHADFSHIFFNMLALWIFGPNVEDLMGRAMFFAFYVLCGLAAAGAHIASVFGGPGMNILNMGASGAILGIMGAYTVLFPLSKLRVFPIFIPVHALWFMFIYMYFQVRNQMMANAAHGGVAYMAHIGGFAFGAGSLLFLMLTKIVVVPNYELVKKGRYAKIPKDQEFIEQMRICIEHKQYARLADTYVNLLADTPGVALDAPTLFELGGAIALAAKPDLAVSTYSKILQRFPESTQAPPAAFEVACIAMREYKDREGAAGYLQWIIAAAPNSPLAVRAKKMLFAIRNPNV